MKGLNGITELDKEFEVIVNGISPRAVNVYTKKDTLNRVWLPLSQITMLKKGIEVTTVYVGDSINVQMPFWLARDKELIS